MHALCLPGRRRQHQPSPRYLIFCIRVIYHKECGVETRLPSGDGRKRRPPSKLITVAVHAINQMTVTMVDALYRPCSCRNIEEASSANCHPSDIRSDFLAVCHHCLDDIASLVALHWLGLFGFRSWEATLVH